MATTVNTGLHTLCSVLACWHIWIHLALDTDSPLKTTPVLPCPKASPALFASPAHLAHLAQMSHFAIHFTRFPAPWPPSYVLNEECDEKSFDLFRSAQAFKTWAPSQLQPCYFSSSPSPRCPGASSERDRDNIHRSCGFSRFFNGEFSWNMFQYFFYVGGLEHFLFFHIYWEFHHPN